MSQSKISKSFDACSHQGVCSVLITIATLIVMLTTHYRNVELLHDVKVLDKSSVIVE